MRSYAGPGLVAPDSLRGLPADLARSIAFYEEALASLGIEHAVDYDGKMDRKGIRISKASGAITGCSFDCARAMRTPGRPMWAS